MDLGLRRDVAGLKRRVRKQEAKSLGPTLGEFYGQFLGLPGLRGLWYPGSQDQTGAIYDQSGQGRTLTYNGNPTLAAYNDLVPYEDYDGTGGDYHSRADEAGLDITGTETTIASALRGLTLGGWFYPTSLLSGSRGLIGKYAAANHSYLLHTSGGGTGWSFLVSTDGTNDVSVTHATAPTTGAWHFVVARFTPSAELSLYVDGVETVNTSSIPASIYSGNGALNIMGFNAGNVSQGYCALAFLAAAAWPDELVNMLWQRSRPLFSV